MERLLKVGEVARLAGLTVRTLHHYDQIGLLEPSGRSAGDYRLYDEADLRRLLAIGHLKSLGLSLEEVAAALDAPGADPAAILASHLEATRSRLEAEQQLLTRLERLQERSNWDDVVAAIELTGQLNHPDAHVRIRAAMESPGRASLEELIDGLRDEEQPAVREMLTWALTQHGGAAPGVVASLSDPDPAVRLQMAHVLGKLRDPTTAPALADLLADPDPAVATKAAFALGQVGGDAALAALVRELGNGDETHRDTVVTALARFGDAALPPLLTRLGDAHPGIRAQAAEALGYLADDRATAPLTQAVEDVDPEVALAAVMALGSIPGDGARSALAAAAASPHERARIAARRLLGS